MNSSPEISRRGIELAATSPTPEYILEHYVRDPIADPIDPNRYIGLCIAQNLLVWDLLEPMVNRNRHVKAESLAYGSMIGSDTLRDEIARFGSARIWGREIDRDNVVALAGAGSILESLFYVLSNPGDSVLVPTPSYAGFWFDLEIRDELSVIPVHTSSIDGFRLTPDLLERALSGAEHPVSALLLTNPDNPTGQIVADSDMAANIEWARGHGLHVVVNEIYALSTHGNVSFQPLTQVIPNIGTDIHQVWGFSKDLAMSGIRAGVVVSENDQVLRAIGELARWSAISGDTQHLLITMLRDTDWTSTYLSEMRRRLQRSYSATTSTLEALGIPYVDAQAGLFLLADFRSFLDSPTWAAEDSMWRRMLDEANLNLTPGSACRMSEPGWFRVCFATEQPETVTMALNRLASVLS